MVLREARKSLREFREIPRNKEEVNEEGNGRYRTVYGEVAWESFPDIAAPYQAEV